MSMVEYNLNNHTIWICWFQGKENLLEHKINSKCFLSWIEKSNHDNIVLLDNNNINEYASEFFDIVNSSPRHTKQARSDLLRLLLLKKYGGTWVDASVYCNNSFEEIFSNTINHTNFFAYRFIPRQLNDRGHKEIVSWYITSVNPYNEFIILLTDLFISKFSDFDYDWIYFTFHQCVVDLYDSNEIAKNTIDNMIQLDAYDPIFSLNKSSTNFGDSYVYKRPPFFLLGG